MKNISVPEFIVIGTILDLFSKPLKSDAKKRVRVSHLAAVDADMSNAPFLTAVCQDCLTTGFTKV